MKIAFIGTGYVGLVSGVMMSSMGHDVVCLDIDNTKISNLKQNILPIYEPGLDGYLKESVAKNKIKFTTEYSKALSNAEVIFVTVGTPSLSSGDADLSYVFKVVDNITKFASNCLIVIKSTVPPGTCNKLNENLPKNLNLKIASNPEFLREGYAVQDFLNPDRIVIGTIDEESANLLKEVYKLFIKRGVSIVSTNLITAELIKYTSNSFLAAKIAFINEIADLSEKVGANIDQLIEGIGLDSRIGQKFLTPGPGFGGSCFPKDINALSKFAKSQKSDFFLLDAVINSNYKRPYNLSNKIIKLFNGNIDNKKITVLGLTFKAGTDDIRNSPAIEIIKILKNSGAIITAFDPKAKDAIELLPDIKYSGTLEQSYLGADALIIATEWPQFQDLDFDKLYEELSTKIIIDLRNILPSKQLIKKGFKYYSIGTRLEQASSL